MARGEGGVRGTSIGQASVVNRSSVKEASTSPASLYMQSIGIPGDPGLCRAQNSLNGNMASEIWSTPSNWALQSLA